LDNRVQLSEAACQVVMCFRYPRVYTLIPGDLSTQPGLTARVPARKIRILEMAAKTNKSRDAGETKGYEPRFLDSESFARASYPRDWLVRGILMSGQPGVLGEPRKTLKTSLAVDMAISLGTGKPFLGHFPVPKARRVAVISGESGEAALQDLALRVAKARKVPWRTAT
jgi:hypothetical protein